MKKIAFLLIPLLLLTLFACDTTPTESDGGQVTPSEPEIIINVPETLVLAVGETVNAGVTFENYTSGKIEYSTDRATIASVDKDGNITALSGGTATITVRAGSQKATFKVTVKRGVSKVSFEEESYTLAIGETVSQEFSYEPEDAFRAEFTYSSSDETVITVSEDGTATAVGAGTANVIVTSLNGVQGTYSVTVLPDASEITLDATSLNLNTGDNIKLTAMVKPDDASDKAVTFTSSDPSVVTVDEDGVVVALKAGSAMITAQCMNVSATCSVAVADAPIVIEVTSVKLNAESVTLYTGQNDSFSLKATIKPTNATEKLITYKSSDEKVCKVSSSGKITPVGVGKATVAATAPNGVKATVNVTVEKTLQTSKPTVLTYNFTDSNTLVIIGTCEDNATVTATNGTDTFVTQADGKQYSVALPKTGNTTTVTITAKSNKKTESEATTYAANYKTPPSEQGMWSMLAGKNYTFFLTKYSGGDLGMKDIMRTNGMSSSAITSFKNNVNRKAAALKAINPKAELIYIVVPSQATIYPEFLPDNIVPTNGASRLEQVITALGETDAKVVDLLTVFREHKNDDLKMYWKTDTHWTDYGGYLAYVGLFDIISEQFPNAAPRPMSDFTFKEDYYYGGDLTVYLKVNRELVVEWNALRVPNFDMPSNISGVQRYVSAKQLTYRDGVIDQKQYVYTSRPQLPSVVVYRDSYSTQMFDIIAERCDTSAFHAMWDYSLNTTEFKNLNADYVIYIINERNIGSILN